MREIIVRSRENPSQAELGRDLVFQAMWHSCQTLVRTPPKKSKELPAAGERPLGRKKVQEALV